MNEDQAQALRKPFKPEQIGKLPRGGTQLAYVGHAAVTGRLLEVDPEWSWEPAAVDEYGLPKIVIHGKNATMWIRLTVAGMTRLGIGIVQSDGFELEKQLISDALRNAAMRFGVALDLWSKEDLWATENPTADPETGEITEPAATKPQRAKIQALVNQTGAVPTPWPLPDELTKREASKIIDWLESFDKEPPAERVATLRTDVPDEPPFHSSAQDTGPVDAPLSPAAETGPVSTLPLDEKPTVVDVPNALNALVDRYDEMLPVELAQLCEQREIKVGTRKQMIERLRAKDAEPF